MSSLGSGTLLASILILLVARWVMAYNHTTNTSALPCQSITEFVIAYSMHVSMSEPSVLFGMMVADIEARKHTEPSLQQIYGPIAYKFPSWAPKNPCFKVRPILMDLPSSDETVGQGAFWNAKAASSGISGVPKSRAFVSKCGLSQCETKMGSLLTVKNIPHLAFDTAPQLSDKVMYPYTFRFSSSNQVMAQLVMHYVNTYHFRTATVIYHMKDFGLGIFRGFASLAQASNFTQRMFAFTLPTLQGKTVQQLCQDIAQRAKWMPTRLIIIFLTSETDAMYTALRSEQLWMPVYQIVSTNAHFLSQLQTGVYIHDLAATPIHFTYQITVVTMDDMTMNYFRNIIALQAMVAAGNSSAIIASHFGRYSLDKWNPLLPSFNSSLVNFSWLLGVSASGDTLEPLFHTAWPFFSFFYAINDLMNSMPANDITDGRIRDAMRTNNFTSVGLFDKQHFDSNQDLVLRWGMHQTCAMLGNKTHINTSDCVGGVPFWTHGFYMVAPFTSGDAGQFTIFPRNTLRWGTGLKSPSAPPELTECQAGQSITGTGSCQMCDEGKFSSTLNATSCVVCPPGKFAELNRTMCTPCQLGKGSAESGVTECVKCPIGHFGPGGSICEQCAQGRYANSQESSACKECAQVLMGSSSLRASTLPEECVCPVGSYRQIDNGTCTSCPAMMTCKMGSAIDNFFAMKQQGFPASDPEMYPLLQELYWSSEQKPLSVFLCNTKVDCPGGRPGSCGPQAKGQSCGECEAEYWRNEQGCHKCASTTITAITFPVIPLVLSSPVICGLYFIFRDMPGKWESWQNLLAALILIAFSHYQSVAIIGAANVDWPSRSDTVFKAVAWTNDMLSLFNVQCIGISGFTGAYIVQIIIPFILGIMCIWTYFCTKAVAACCIRNVGMNKDRLVNVYMSLIYTFFTAIASGTMLLLKFKKSPNGELALSKDSSVLQSSGEWESLLYLGIMAVLVECVGVMVLFLYVIRIAPSRFRYEYFQKRWKFLFIKYRPDLYWWGVPYLIRGVLTNLALVILIKGARQLFWIYFAMLSYCCSVVAFHPWRNGPTNGLDILGSIVVASVAALGTWFASERGLTNDVEYVMIVLKFGTAVTFIAAFIALVVPKALSVKLAVLRRKNTMNQMTDLRNLRMASKIMTNLDQSSAEEFYLDFLGHNDRTILNKAAHCILLEFRIYQSAHRICRDDWHGHGGGDEILKSFPVSPVRSAPSSPNRRDSPVNDSANAFVIESSRSADKESNIEKAIESTIEYIEEYKLQHTPLQQRSVDPIDQMDSVEWPYENTPRASGWTCAYPLSPTVPAAVTSTRQQMSLVTPRYSAAITPKEISAVSPKETSAVSPKTTTPRVVGAKLGAEAPLQN